MILAKAASLSPWHAWKTIPDTKCDKVLIILFTLIFAGFFFLDRSFHRYMFYLTIPFGGYFLYKNFALDALKPIKITAWILVAYLIFNSITFLWVTVDDISFLKYAKLFPIILYTCSIIFFLQIKYNDFWAVMVKAFIYGAIGSAMYLLATNIPALISLFDASTLDRIKGIGRIENASYAGVFYALAFLCVLFEPPKTKHPIWFKIIACMLFALIIAMTGTRQAPLIIVACIGAMLLIKGHYKWLGGIAVVSLITAAILFFATDFMNTAYNMRGDSGRLDIWSGAWDHIKERPLLGYGHGAGFEYPVRYYNNGLISTANHEHSLYLGTALRTGFIGLAIFLSLILGIAWHAYKNRYDGNIQTACVFILVGLLMGVLDLHGYFTGLNPEYALFWIPASFLLALSSRAQLQNR